MYHSIYIFVDGSMLQNCKTTVIVLQCIVFNSLINLIYHVI